MDINITEINDTFLSLDKTCQKLFFDYGLRLIKYMFEHDSVMTDSPPDGAKLVGLSYPFYRWTSLDTVNKKRYGYFRGQVPSWSEADNYEFEGRYDLIEDFKTIYEKFNLINYELSDLTEVHLSVKELNNENNAYK